MAYYANKTQGIFVNQLSLSGVKYADLIVDGIKTIETRNKNMLSDLIGLRVAIIRTVRGKKPTVIGYATITSANRYHGKWHDEHRNLTCIPEGSKYDFSDRPGARWTKWCYELSDPERCEPFELPSSAIRHGRSWCEFDMPDMMSDCTGECDSCPHRKRVPGDIDRIDREPAYFCDYSKH